MTVDYQAQTQEFGRSVKPVLESYASDIRRLFMQSGIISDNIFANSCFPENPGDDWDWHNALYCLMDEYKNLLESASQKNECILFKPIVEAVAVPVKAYCTANSIPLEYSRPDFQREYTDARTRGSTLLTGIEHSLAKNVISRYNSAILAEKTRGTRHAK